MSDFEIDVNESCLSDHPFIIQEFDELTAGVFNVLSYSASSIKPNFSRIPEIHAKLKTEWASFPAKERPTDFKDFYTKWMAKKSWPAAGTLMDDIITEFADATRNDPYRTDNFDAFWHKKTGIFSKIATGAFGGFKFDVLDGPSNRVVINKDVLKKLQNPIEVPAALSAALSAALQKLPEEKREAAQKAQEAQVAAMKAVNGISGKDEYLKNMISEFFGESVVKPTILVCPEFDFIEVLEALGGGGESGGVYPIHKGIPLTKIRGLGCVLVGEWCKPSFLVAHTDGSKKINIPKFMEARAGTGQPKTNNCRVIFYKNMTFGNVTPLETEEKDDKDVSLSEYKLDDIKFKYTNVRNEEKELTCYAVHAKSLMPVGKKKMEEMNKKVVEMNAFNKIIEAAVGTKAAPAFGNIRAKEKVLYLGDFNYPMVTGKDGAISSSQDAGKETPLQYKMQEEEDEDGSFKGHIETLGLSAHEHAAYAGAILKSRVWDFINEQLGKAMDKNEYRKYGSDFIFSKGFKVENLYDIRTVNDMKKWKKQTNHEYLKAPTIWRNVEFPAAPEGHVCSSSTGDSAKRRENVFYPYFYKQQSSGGKPSAHNRVLLESREAVAAAARSAGEAGAGSAGEAGAGSAELVTKTQPWINLGGRRLRSRRSRRRSARRTQKRRSSIRKRSGRSLRKRRSLRRRRGRRSRRM